MGLVGDGMSDKCCDMLKRDVCSVVLFYKKRVEEGGCVDKRCFSF